MERIGWEFLDICGSGIECMVGGDIEMVWWWGYGDGDVAVKEQDGGATVE